jgi:hypothetical protein
MAIEYAVWAENCNLHQSFVWVAKNTELGLWQAGIFLYWDSAESFRNGSFQFLLQLEHVNVSISDWMYCGFFTKLFIRYIYISFLRKSGFRENRLNEFISVFSTFIDWFQRNSGEIFTFSLKSEGVKSIIYLRVLIKFCQHFLQSSSDLDKMCFRKCPYNSKLCRGFCANRRKVSYILLC